MTANPISNIPPIGPMSGQTPGGPVGPFKPVDPVKLLRRHMWLIIITAVVGLMIGVGTYVTLRYLAPQFTSQALLHVSSPMDVRDIETGIFGSASASRASEEIEMFIAAEIQRIKSDEILSRVLQRDEVRATSWFKQFNGDLESAVLNLQENTIRASSIRGAPLIRLSAATRLKGESPVLLDNLIEVYLDKRQSLAAEESAGSHKVFSDENAAHLREVEALTEARTRFTKDNDLDSIRERDSAIRLEFENLTRQKLALEYALNAEEANYSALKDMNAAGGEPTADQVQEVMARPEMQGRQRDINSLRSQISALLSGGYKREHRAVRRAQEQLDALEADLKVEQERLVREGLAAQIAASARAVENYRSQLAALADPISEARQRMTDYRGLLDKYEEIQERLAKAQADYDQSKANLDRIWRSRNLPAANRVRRQAGPDEPQLTSPKALVVVPGITFLLLGGVVGLLFLREMLDQRMRSPADLKLLPGVSMLGVLPDTSEDPSGATRIERVVERQPAGLMAESFRQVRTAVLSRMDRRGYKSLLVCSAQPASGTTSVAQNLAASVALNGRRVLLIDANFRRPNQHNLTGIDNSTGLAEVLLGRCEPDSVIYPIEGISLSVMPTGRGQGAAPELLEGQAFRALMARVEAAFDLIIIDAPPTLLTSDGQVLAKQVDAVAMVVRAGVDKRGMIERMHRQLDGQRADILGIILNGVQSAAGGYFRKSYEEFYRYNQPRNGLAGLTGGRLAESGDDTGAAAVESSQRTER